VLGIGLMIVAAFLQASASVLQRRSARTEPDSAEFSLRLIADLARRPGWLLGIAAMISGFLLHAVSISLSRIALVQPILVAELPFTLVLAAWTFRLPLSGRDWLAVGMATAGLAAFLGCLAPTGGDPGQVAGSTWALGAAITVVAVGALVLLGYRARREHGAALLGIATGAALIAAGTTTLSRSRLLDPDATRRATQRDAEHEDAERKDAEQNKEARPQPDDTSQAPSRGHR
jgi:drug/metabolite transporter (DMT)-like permease